MSVSAAERVKELTQGMLRKKLYVITSTGKPGADLLPVLPKHLEYMIALEREGKLFGSGPFDVGTSGDGMTILRVATRAEAEEIAARDPFVIAGLRTAAIREWMLMEGSFGVSVNFSDRSVTID